MKVIYVLKFLCNNKKRKTIHPYIFQEKIYTSACLLFITAATKLL